MIAFSTQLHGKSKKRRLVGCVLQYIAQATIRSAEDGGILLAGGKAMLSKETSKGIKRVEKIKTIELDLSDKDLTTVPPEVFQANRLILLNLCNNHLKSLPPEIGQLTKLKELHLGLNQLRSLPDEIRQLTNLEKLFLWKNHLASLPVSICDLPHLIELDLGCNHLTRLPLQISQLSHLQCLDLSENDLTALPSTISKLTNLTHLSLYKNNLRSLPLELFKLRCLRYLSLWGNPLVVELLRCRLHTIAKQDGISTLSQQPQQKKRQRNGIRSQVMPYQLTTIPCRDLAECIRSMRVREWCVLCPSFQTESQLCALFFKH
jgi:leucine-rich repeat protein SHOC2